MSSHPAYIIDAFTKDRFTGNQAAVVLIPHPLSDKEYQRIAAEFNLSETAYPVPENGDFKTASRFSLRWFTPKVEVPLCGHATLATSHTLLYEVGNTSSSITFSTKSGDLCVSRHPGGLVEMDFPQFQITSIRFPHMKNPLEDTFPEFDAPSYLYDVIKCLVPDDMNIEYVGYASEAKKLIVVVDPQTTKFELGQLECDFKKMLELHPEGSFVRGVMVTLAPKNAEQQGFSDSCGVPYDYVCRYFAPWVGIEEDPATGSAQCALAPFWSKILNKDNFYAYQSYPRRGAQFKLQLKDGGRIGLIGQSVTVMQGELHTDGANFY